VLEELVEALLNVSVERVRLHLAGHSDGPVHRIDATPTGEALA
jgi:hypothetical protein